MVSVRLLVEAIQMSSGSVILEENNTERNHMITKDFSNKDGSTLNRINSNSFDVNDPNAFPKNKTLNQISLKKALNTPKGSDIGMVKANSDTKSRSKISKNRIKTDQVQSNLDKEHFPF